MDGQTIFTAVITSLLSSSLITAGAIYMVKKSIDRATSEQMILALKRSLTRLDEEHVKLLEEAQKRLGMPESGSRDR